MQLGAYPAKRRQQVRDRETTGAAQGEVGERDKEKQLVHVARTGGAAPSCSCAIATSQAFQKEGAAEAAQVRGEQQGPYVPCVLFGGRHRGGRVQWTDTKRGEP